MRFWSGDTIKELKENQIFVFGSNPSGIHGAGAAKAAVEFGAQYGVGRGLQGQTYALITKNLKAGYHEKATGITYATEGYKSLSADQISENVKELYQCAKQHPDKFFILAYKNETWPNGSSKKSLNGYTSEEMFELFMNDGDVPDNVILHNSFKPLAKTYLENKQTEQEKNMDNITEFSDQLNESFDEFEHKCKLAVTALGLDEEYELGGCKEEHFLENLEDFTVYKVEQGKNDQLIMFNDEIAVILDFSKPVDEAVKKYHLDGTESITFNGQDHEASLSGIHTIEMKHIGDDSFKIQGNTYYSLDETYNEPEIEPEKPEAKKKRTHKP